MIKIAFIGGGAYLFPLTLIRDILSFPALQKTHFSLMDIDLDKANNNASVVETIIKEFNLPASVETTTQLEKAFNKANFIFCTFQIGGLEAYRYDVEIPRKYGVDQTVGDTIGPGGVFRGLRTIAVLTEIAKVYKKYCPQALVIQYANPMAINSWAASLLKIKNIGLCHSVQGTSYNLAKTVGVPIEECNYICAGVNHQAWFIEFKHKNKDILPQIREKMQKQISFDLKEKDNQLHGKRFERVRTEIMNLTGFFQTESSDHASEYLGYFRKTQKLVKEYLPKRWDYYKICSAHNQEKAQEYFLKETKKTGLVRTQEYGAYIVDSIITNIPRIIHGSVPNTNLISNLPYGASVEVPCLVNSNGVQPLFVGDLPEVCAAINSLSINVHRLTVKAGLLGDPSLALAAIALDPLTSTQCTLPQIREMTKEMFEKEKEWLPQFKFTKGKICF